MTTDLIAKLEALEGPTREVDAEIWWNFGKGKIDYPEYKDLDALHACGKIFGQLIGSDLEWRSVGYRGPSFTASIDAAMTLIPEGWGLRLLHNTKPDFTDDHAFAMVTRVTVEHDYQGSAPTPAIAICIAAVKTEGEG